MQKKANEDLGTACVHSWEGRGKKIKLRVELMPQVTALAQEEGRKKMDMEENAGYKKSELLPEHSMSGRQEEI